MQRGKKQTRITDFFSQGHDPCINEIETQAPEIKEIDFLQANNQKRIISNEAVTYISDKLGSFCILGQEPSTYGFNVTGINSRHTLVQAPVEKPRAYLVCHKGLNAWPVENLCSKDVACAIIDTKLQDVGKILAVSIYWDGRIDTYPKEATEAKN